MKGERKDSAEAIASEALGLSPGERSAFVEKRCAGNEALLQEVQALLSQKEGEDHRDTSDLDATIAADGSGQASGKPAGSREFEEAEELDPLTLLRAFKESDPDAILPGGNGTKKAGDEIGPYQLRQKIGEGGFGVVWMAGQKEPISRKVALKEEPVGVKIQGWIEQAKKEIASTREADAENVEEKSPE